MYDVCISWRLFPLLPFQWNEKPPPQRFERVQLIEFPHIEKATIRRSLRKSPLSHPRVYFSFFCDLLKLHKKTRVFSESTPAPPFQVGKHNTDLFITQSLFSFEIFSPSRPPRR